MLKHSYETYLMIKRSAFEPPMSLADIKTKYGEDLYKKLSKDPVHRWRAENGVELLHEEPTIEEFERILANWKLMNKQQKQLSDEQSIQLFGKDNLSRIEAIRRSYNQKKASKLYTYVDPNADLSQGLLSLRNAPEEFVVRRYGKSIKEPKNRNKEHILKWIEGLGNDPSRPDWIYALDAPIPDNANEGLLRFRDTHKLVSWDPEQVEDIKQILRRYNNPKTREQVNANFKPLEHINWNKSTPTYKILTESGKIPAELLHYE